MSGISYDPDNNDIVVTQSALPDGASTEAKQDAANSNLNSILLFLSSIFTRQSDGTQQAKLRGDTDETLIGNDDDRLRTITTFDKSLTTAFGRLQTSVPTILFQANFVENARRDLFDQRLTTGATITRDATKKHMNLSTTTTSGSKAEFQTFQRIKYTAGQQNRAIMVQLFEPKANVLQEASFADENDGFYFRMNGTTFSVGIRNSISGSVVENNITQANFNIDRLDGTGPSGITIDLTKVQILFVDFQWLGAGSVFFGISIHGQIIKFHREDHSNIIAETKYTRTANLPFRYVVENLAATASATTMQVSCLSNVSEGLEESAPVQRFLYNTESKTLPNGGAYEPMVAVRLKASSNTANFKVIGFGLLDDAKDSLACEVVIGGTLTGGVWNSVDDDSSLEVNLTATAHTGGIVIDGLLLASDASAKTSGAKNLLQGGKAIDGTSQVILLRARTLNNNASSFGSLTVEELY